MEDETPLQRLHRECPFTYEQLKANVGLFCRSHDLAIVAEDVFAEDWVNNWQQLVDFHIFLVEADLLGQEEELVENEGYV